MTELEKSFLQGMKENADREIQGHLSAGRSVYGLRDGKLIEITPKPVTPAKEDLDGAPQEAT